MFATVTVLEANEETDIVQVAVEYTPGVDVGTVAFLLYSAALELDPNVAREN